MSSEREKLLEELTNEVRANQRATAIVDDATDALLGVNRTDGRCLDLLEQRGQMSAGELARESGLTTGAITAVIDRLERAGYARRERHPGDRRKVLVSLTPLAAERAQPVFAPMEEAVGEVLATYDDAQLALLLTFLRRMRDVSVAVIGQFSRSPP